MRGNRVVSDRRDTERVNANYTPESNPLSPAHQAVKSKITNNPASSSKIGMHIVEFAGFLFALEPPWAFCYNTEVANIQEKWR